MLWCPETYKLFQLLALIFKKNKIETEFKIPDDELYVLLDYNRMKQVLVNILKNAIEAKSPRRKSKVWIEIIEENNTVAIQIKDNGIGMSAATLKRVDEMFYTTKEKGTGLGVSLSKEIIELHNGKLKYTSTEGRGTTVTITLPI